MIHHIGGTRQSYETKYFLVMFCVIYTVHCTLRYMPQVLGYVQCTVHKRGKRGVKSFVVQLVLESCGDTLYHLGESHG